jgi:hypothetical protein
MNGLPIYSGTPDIQVDGDELAFSDYPWSASAFENRPFAYEQSHPHKLVQVFDTEIPLQIRSTNNMSNIQRFFTDNPFHSLLKAESGRSYGTPPPYQGNNYYYQQEFTNPLPGAEDVIRQHSPGATSSSWSSSPREEFKSMGMFRTITPTGYPSPTDSTAFGLPYPDQCHDSIAHDVLIGGGSGVSLSQIQATPDVFECSLDEKLAQSEVKPYGHSMDPGYDLCYNHDQSDTGELFLDAESVHRVATDDDQADSDYKPKRNNRKRAHSNPSESISGKRVRISTGRKSSNVSTESRKKKTRRASNSNNQNLNIKTTGAARPFLCPFAKYGCSATFGSKNEWKRHVATQHVRIGYWRCDLCQPSHDSANTTTYYNDFNRKDLFMQHLRRMHATPETPNSSAKDSSDDSTLPVNEANLPRHQQRCFNKVRDLPESSSCLFCSRTFRGPNSWDERMEHVGRHFEKDGSTCKDVTTWRVDKGFQQWLLNEGLVEHNGQEWSLGDGVPKRDFPDFEGSTDGDLGEEDADGELVDEED